MIEFPKNIYLIPIGISHTNGGSYDYIYSPFESISINQYLLNNERYNYFIPGTEDPETGEYHDNEFFIETWISYYEDTPRKITSDPKEIEEIFYMDTTILGYETFHKFPRTPPIQGPEIPPKDPDEIPF